MAPEIEEFRLGCKPNFNPACFHIEIKQCPTQMFGRGRRGFGGEKDMGIKAYFCLLKRTRNDHFHDLVCTAVNLLHAAIAEHASDAVFIHKAVTAVKL